MKAESVYDFYNELKDDAFNLIYLGEFDDELTTIFLEINEVSKGEVKSYKKKISFLIAECFQNIIRHSDDKSTEILAASLPRMFMLRDKGNMHHIVTTNLVEHSKKEFLANSLGRLQNLTKDELREVYLNALATNERSEKGGAGLGLIEMARKSGNAPSFEFIDITDQYANFFMQVNVLPKDVEAKFDAADLSVKSAMSIYNRMMDQNIILVQKGDFSQDSIVPLIQLFEGNLELGESNMVFKKKALYILIEMLQNITMHSNKFNSGKQGILIVGKRPSGDYEISTGNYVSKEKGEELQGELDEIADLSKIELTKRYKKQLMSNVHSEGKGAGIGLIEICRNSSERINYIIEKVDDELSFFSFNVKL